MSDLNAPADRQSIVHRAASSTPQRPSRYDVLFDQIRLGPKVMKNRFYQTPHCTSLGVLRPGAQARLRGTKAEGGWAVVNTEYCSIHPESDDSPWVGARIWDDTDIHNLSAMTAAAHEHGSLAGIQLWYGGSVGTGLESRLPARGVSALPNESYGGYSAFAMDLQDIQELQGFFKKAARRALQADFDIVLLGAEEVGGILSHFLMPYYNKRTDAYGGSIANRARFLVETLEAVRATVGDYCAVGVRLCVDTLDRTPGGMRAGVEGCETMNLADHLVDYWDVQVGGWSSDHWGEDAASSRFSNENFQGPWIEQVREATNKPLVGVGRFTSPDTMVGVIRSGQQDLIGAARPSIADPFLPAKIEGGRVDDLRECIGCNICVSRYSQTVPISCTQNPTLGEEYRRGWHPELVPRARNTSEPVLIIGAGPAGLECAVTLGKRGFEYVHVVDAAPMPGGTMRWIPRLPGLAEWSRVVEYRVGQIHRLSNVELIPNRTLSMEDVLDYGASLVVSATGAVWDRGGQSWANRGPIPGAALYDHVLTPDQLVVAEEAVTGERALIYDCDGYFMAVSLAERLVDEGREVTLITPSAEVAPFMRHTFEWVDMKRRIDDLGVAVRVKEMLTEVRAEHVITRGLDDTNERKSAADAVVLVTRRSSHDWLYRSLRERPEKLEAAGIRGMFRIGDCVVPRLTADVIFDGHRLAREIDSANPNVARPYRRENRVIERQRDLS